MAGLAPEVREEIFRGLPGQLQIDSIGTQLDLIIPSDLPAGADVDLCKEVLILPRLEDALPRPASSDRSTEPSVPSENTTLIRKFGNAHTEIGFTIFGPSPSPRIMDNGSLTNPSIRGERGRVRVSLFSIFSTLGPCGGRRAGIRCTNQNLP